MQIHELNALSRAPQTGDVLAIDTGTDTAKIDYNALATAIINKLGGDPVTIPHGGTGAATADGARTNLDVYSKGETDTAIAQSNKYMYCDTDNKQTFTFENLSLLNNTGKYKYGLLFGGEPNAPFVYHLFAEVDNTITITPILSSGNPVTFTGSVSGTTLTLTGNRVAYGGVRLIWINT